VALFSFSVFSWEFDPRKPSGWHGRKSRPKRTWRDLPSQKQEKTGYSSIAGPLVKLVACNFARRTRSHHSGQLPARSREYYIIEIGLIQDGYVTTVATFHYGRAQKPRELGIIMGNSPNVIETVSTRTIAAKHGRYI
jgi:hypothetical protein